MWEVPTFDSLFTQMIAELQLEDDEDKHHEDVCIDRIVGVVLTQAITSEKHSVTRIKRVDMGHSDNGNTQ